MIILSLEEKTMMGESLGNRDGVRQMNESNIRYSIVIPVYNSEDSLRELIARTIRVLEDITPDYEIVLVDDCSSDNSWKIMKELKENNKNIKIIHLIRNFGQHNATLCGFNFCGGQNILTMDDDLQHPPEEIPKLIQKMEEGFSVVYGKYQIKHHSNIENFFSRRFQLLIHHILNIPDDIFISSFALFNSKIVKHISTIKTSYVFLPALISKSTPVNKIANVEVIHHSRRVGTSNYDFLKYLRLALNLIINYSALPLIIVSSFGLGLSILSMGFGISIIIEKFINPSYGVVGWNSLMVSIAFLGGIILFTLGIIGEYLRRILAEVSYEQPFAIGEMYIQ
jgi:glycosyltransferase involved in cell wall biosynthesis